MVIGINRIIYFTLIILKSHFNNDSKFYNPYDFTHIYHQSNHVYTKKTFLNVNPNQIWIAITLLWIDLAQNRIQFDLSEKSNYNRNFVCITVIEKRHTPAIMLTSFALYLLAWWRCRHSSTKPAVVMKSLPELSAVACWWITRILYSDIPTEQVFSKSYYINPNLVSFSKVQQLVSMWPVII